MTDSEGEQVFVRLVELVKRWNRTQEDSIDLAVQFWIEYATGAGGIYRTLHMEKFKGKDEFLRRFVWLRLKREGSISFKRENTHVDMSTVYDLSSSFPLPGAEMIRIEEETAVNIAMQRVALLRDKREVSVALCLIEGLEYREIAKRLDCSLGTVGNLIKRLRKRPEILQLKLLVNARS